MGGAAKHRSPQCQAVACEQACTGGGAASAPGEVGRQGVATAPALSATRVRRRAVPLAFGTGAGCDFLKPQVYSPVNCGLQVGGLSCDTVSSRPSKLQQEDQRARHLEFTTFTVLKCATQWHEVPAQCCAAVTTVHLHNPSSPQRHPPH